MKDTASVADTSMADTSYIGDQSMRIDDDYFDNGFDHATQHFGKRRNVSPKTVEKKNSNLDTTIVTDCGVDFDDNI